jgi:hypothetical protein
MRRGILVLISVLFVLFSGTSFFAQQPGGMSLVFSQRTDGSRFSAFARDSSGLLWAVGNTCSAAMPTTADALMPTARGGCDAFVARLHPDGTVLYLTYLGGSGSDFANGVTLDASGNVYVAGYTSSVDFPTTEGAYDRTCGADGTCKRTWAGGQQIEVDAYITKLTPSGRALVYSTYFGGVHFDYASAIAVDSLGRAHIVGSTHSDDMPKTAGAVRTAITGIYQDVFYARFNTSGSALEYSTLLGGSGLDNGTGITLDAAGSAYLAGTTQSSDFTLFRPFKPTFGGGSQGWLARFDNGTLQYSTYIGGSNSDTAYDVAVDSEGVYVAGGACSGDFPGAPRPSAPTTACDQAAYVAKVRLDGSALIRTSLLDGNGNDGAYTLEVNTGSVVHVVGSAGSSNFPVTPDAAQATLAGPQDAFYAVVPMGGAATGAPAYATLLGGAAGTEQAMTLAFDGAGGAFVGGASSSDDFPTVNGTPPSARSEGMSFIAHFVPVAATEHDIPGEVVLYARDASPIRGDWQLVSDPTAAAGVRIWNPDAGVPKIGTPSAAPASFFELTFQAEAGVPHRLWLRMKADNDHWANDSLYVQFSDSVDASGNPIWRIGTTSATTVSLEDCTGCGEHGWGWNDNGYNTPGMLVTFATSGMHTLRIQQREDGISVDQVVLSKEAYLTTAPGTPKDDAHILTHSDGGSSEPPPPPPADAREIVMYVARELLPGSHNWFVTSDASAAGGARLFNPDQGAPKATSVLSAYPDYFEVQFTAEAGIPYHLWVRSQAQNDYYGNDSISVQFSDSVDASGNPIWRSGTDSATTVVLEDCGGCGEQGWGWQDNAYGGFGAHVYFAKSGPQTIRVVRREDGMSIDQIVLSAGRYLTSSPGVLKNDATIVPK